MSTIESQLGDALKAGMRAKDTDRVACIRQVKARMQETVNAEGFKGEVNDALYQEVIGSYVKILKKSVDEMASAGEKTQALRDKYTAEITYLEQYLPKVLGEAKTRDIVKSILSELNVTDPKQSGRVMGAIMKDYKGKVDPGMAKRILDELLGGS